MAITITPLPPDGFRRTPWKNGGGTTIDIADAYAPGSVAGSWTGMVWRLGRTSIVAPGPFSDLTGFERCQLVIRGEGLVLVAPDHEIDLRRAFDPVRYDGATPIASRLENGPVEVVNLIANRELCAIELSAPAAGDQSELVPGIHVLYAAEDTCTVVLGGRSLVISAGHAMRIDLVETAALSVSSGRPVLATIVPR